MQLDSLTILVTTSPQSVADIILLTNQIWPGSYVQNQLPLRMLLLIAAAAETLLLVLKFFLPVLRYRHVLVCLENSMTIRYINHHSKMKLDSSCHLAWALFRWIHPWIVLLRASRLPRLYNSTWYICPWQSGKLHTGLSDYGNSMHWQLWFSLVKPESLLGKYALAHHVLYAFPLPLLHYWFFPCCTELSN